MHDRMNRICRTLLAALAWCASASGPSLAEEPGDAPMSFHRVYAPADRIDEWPRGSVRYVPMDREAFERTVAEMDAEARGPAKGNTRVERAQYAARLDDDGVLRGRSELTIAHGGKRGTMLPLGKCDLAITAAAWTDEPTQAVLGIAGDGQLSLLVERAGTLRFDFVLRGTSRSERDAFDARIPSGATTRWLLDAPLAATPAVEGGFVEATDAKPAPADGEAEAPDPNAARRVWKIELGASNRLALTVSKPQSPGEQIVATQQTTDYSIAPSGLTIQSKLVLNFHRETANRVTFRLDAEATLVGATAAGEAARVVGYRRGADGGQWITVEMPAAASGAERVLTLDAIAPASLGKRWRLPRVVAEGIPWQRAEARIAARGGLRIQQLWPAGAQLSAAASTTSATLTYLAADASVEIAVDFAPRETRAETALVVEVGNEARGQAVVEAAFSAAVPTTLSGRVHENWIVEGIAATPADAVADWQIAVDEQGRETISLECRPDATRTARIVATVRRRESPEQRPIAASDLRAIDWSGSCRVTRSLASIAPARSYQLSVGGVHRLAAISASDKAARKLLGEHSGQLQFDADSAGSRFSVSARRAATPYRGEVDVESLFSGESVHDTIRLRCLPQGDGLAQIVVRITPAATENMTWKDAKNPEAQVAARRLSDGESRAFLIEPGSEAWMFSFAEPRAAAFELFGTRTRQFEDAAPVALAAFQNASGQTGTLTVRAARGTLIGIENRRLTPVPPREESLTESSDVRGRYRYMPARDVAMSEAAASVVRSDVVSGAAVAYRCDATVRVEASGKTVCRTSFFLENMGRSHVVVTLPEGTERHETFVDGDPSVEATTSGEAIRIALPAERRFVRVTVDCERDEAALAWYARRTFVAPEMDVTVLERRWTLLVPETYALLGGGSERGDLSWQERWFGPLARRDREAEFDPASWTSWLAQSAGRDEIAAATEAVNALLARIGAARTAVSGDRDASWGTLLAAAADERTYVDAAALDRAAIEPWTPLPATVRESAEASAVRLLFDAGLAVVTDGLRCAITSTAVAAELGKSEELSLPRYGGVRLMVVRVAVGGPARDEAGDAVSGLSERRSVVAAKHWTALVGMHALPWSAEASSPAWHGWRRVRLVDDGASVSARFVDLEWLHSAAWIAFLAAAAALAWSWSRRTAAVWWSLAATAFVALVLDEDWLVLAPLLWGVWWGGCFGAVLARLPMRRRSTLLDVATPSAASWRLRKAATATVLLVAALWAVRAWADDGQSAEPNGATRAAKTHLYQVFYPVDDAQKPVGTRVYVPEPLFARLERWNLERQRGPQGAVIVSAVERVQLDWNTDGTALESRAGSATIDVVTFDDEARVRLPISAKSDAREDDASGETPADGIRLDGALLDGESLTVENGVATVAIAKAGNHRIEVPMSAAIVERGGRQDLTLRTVAAGVARLEITAPQNGPEIEVISASDGALVHRGRGMLSLPTSGGRSYFVRWPQGQPRAGMERLESAERLWLDVHPGAVGFTAEVVLSSPAALPEELRAVVDARLVPLSASVNGAATTWRRVGTDGDQLAFRLGAANGSHEARLEAKFLLREASGIGSLRAPRWEPVVAEVRRRWIAISIDEALDHEISAGPETPPMAPGDFVQDESEDVLPRYVYRLPAGATTLSLTTRERTKRVRFDPAVWVVAEPGGARVILDAEIAVGSGEIYAYGLRCHDRLQVERIAVLEDDVDRAAFWTQGPDGAVQVFLDARAGSRQRLRLEGRVDASADGTVTLGEFALDGAQRSPMQLRLYRRPGVRMKVGDLTGFAEAAGPAATSSAARPLGERYAPPPDARLVRDLVAGSEGPAVAVVQVESNAPKIETASLVAVESLGADAWTVRAQFRGKIEEGIVDDLVLDLPGDWIGEPTIDPAMPMTEVEAADGTRRIVVRPALPLRGEFSFAVSGRLRTPGSRGAPRWKLLDADVEREFCALPTLWQGRNIGWDFVEMRPASPGAGFSMPRFEGARYGAFELLGERASATLQAEVPSAKTLETYVHVAAADANDGSQRVVATYDLLPSGVAFCRFAVPANARLAAAMLEGRAVTPRQIGPHEVQIELESGSLPQRLQLIVVVDGGDAMGDRRKWETPQLLDATVRQTTWNVSTTAGRIGDATTLPAADERAASEARAKALAEMWAAASSSSSESKAQVARRWERRLAARTRATSGDAQAGGWSYVLIGDANATADAAVNELLQQFGGTRLGRFGDEALFELPAAQAGRFADQFRRDGGAAARAMVFASPPKIVERSALAAASFADRRNASFVVDGAAWTLEANIATNARVPWARWGLAALVAAIAVVLARRGPRRRVAEAFARRPYLALVGLGVAWWLWFWPGWLGWAFVALGVVLAWRMTWPLPRVEVRSRPSSNA